MSVIASNSPDANYHIFYVPFSFLLLEISFLQCKSSDWIDTIPLLLYFARQLRLMIFRMQPDKVLFRFYVHILCTYNNLSNNKFELVVFFSPKNSHSVSVPIVVGNCSPRKSFLLYDFFAFLCVKKCQYEDESYIKLQVRGRRRTGFH